MRSGYTELRAGDTDFDDHFLFWKLYIIMIGIDGVTQWHKISFFGILCKITDTAADEEKKY